MAAIGSHEEQEYALEHCWSCGGDGSNYLDPDAKLLTAPCTHRVCVRCSNRELSRASQVTCSHCSKKFYRHELKKKDADTSQYEKEVQVRKDLARVFSKRSVDFLDECNGDKAAADRAWDSYQEKHERLVRWMTDGTNVAEAKKDIAAEQASARAGIQKAAKHRTDENRALQAKLQVERDRRLTKMAKEAESRARRIRILKEKSRRTAEISLHTDKPEVAAKLAADIQRQTMDKLEELQHDLEDRAAAASASALQEDSEQVKVLARPLSLPQVLPPRVLAGPPQLIGPGSALKAADRKFTITPALGGGPKIQSSSSQSVSLDGRRGTRSRVRDRAYLAGWDSREALRAGGVSLDVLSQSRSRLALSALRTWPVGRQSNVGLLRAAGAIAGRKRGRGQGAVSGGRKGGEGAGGAAGVVPKVRIKVGTKRARVS